GHSPECAKDGRSHTERMDVNGSEFANPDGQHMLESLLPVSVLLNK
ncbi:hypothetical protein chiPu_0025102, partial [Chiloscyllium punctatum]|nr:hypothetical protein [Chiloscyllium punctatum]